MHCLKPANKPAGTEPKPESEDPPARGRRPNPAAPCPQRPQKKTQMDGGDNGDNGGGDEGGENTLEWVYGRPGRACQRNTTEKVNPWAACWGSNN